MKKIYSYPGSFCPPTIGHLQIVKDSAKIFPRVSVFCSTNAEKKSPWFSEEECREMWLYYSLPKNVSVYTLSAVIENINLENVIMIRGIRNAEDLEHEKKVMLENKIFGIEKFFYIFSKCRYEKISSSLVRRLVMENNFQEVKKYVSAPILQKLIKKAKEIKNDY